MKKILSQLLTALALSGSPALALSVDIYLDSAPNIHGSSNYAPWWSSAKDAAVDGNFVNMANSINPALVGSTFFELEDMVVYSFGDLGKRLHFVYWVPNETINGLTNKNFQIAMDYVWDGVTYDFYNDYYGSTWLTPGSWADYRGGVIGTAGFAWWGAYGVNTPAALAQDLVDWRPYVGDVTLKVRWDIGEAALVAHHNLPGVPDSGATLGMVGFAVAVLGWLRRRLIA